MRRAVALAVAGLLAGCASTRIELEELPDAPIVMVYRTPEQGRQLAELRGKAEDRRQQRAREEGQRRDPNIVDLGKVGELLALREPPMARLRELSGRVSMGNPRSGEVVPVEATLRGARPLQWSPDRTRFLFVSPRLDRPQVFEVDVKSGEVRPRTHGKAHISGGYGPGRRLVVSTMEVRGGAPGMRVQVRGERSGWVDVTAGPFDLDPIWSPDGDAVVYTTRQAGGRIEAIARVSPEGGPARILARRASDPVFTPDGRWIVYSAETPAGRRLWKMRPDGGRKAPLGSGLQEERSPAVSPDGRFVAYVAEEEDGRQRIRVRRFDGTGDRLLFEEGDGSDPIW